MSIINFSWIFCFLVGESFGYTLYFDIAWKYINIEFQNLKDKNSEAFFDNAPIKLEEFVLNLGNSKLSIFAAEPIIATKYG